jgi:hypothetical protein
MYIVYIYLFVYLYICIYFLFLSWIILYISIYRKIYRLHQSVSIIHKPINECHIVFTCVVILSRIQWILLNQRHIHPFQVVNCFVANIIFSLTRVEIVSRMKWPTESTNSNKKIPSSSSLSYPTKT